MAEANIKLCSKCNIPKIRIIVGYWGKNKRYVDETNRLWNASVCPQCNVSRVKKHMRDLRTQRSNDSTKKV